MFLPALFASLLVSGYTESDSKIGRWQGEALTLSQAKPSTKQLNLNKLSDAVGLKGSGSSTQPEPIFESRAVYQETLYPDWKQTFTVEKVIHQEKTPFWDLTLFENSRFGRVLSIDGVVQLTEKDEFIYHEMMAHVPLLAHGHARSVLIVGGGDGGLLREVLRHESLQKVVLVEIDPLIIELSKKHLPMVSQGAFENPRAQILIQDAVQYVKETEETFDVILCDSTDPEGPAKALFTSEFYGDCKNLLNSGGIFVNQNGVPFVQKSELLLTIENRKPHFKHVHFFVAPVPTYVGGFMAFGWASDKKYSPSLKILEHRLKSIQGKMRYYTPAIHRASFALPAYMND